MEIIQKRLSLAEFRSYVAAYDFGPLPPDKLVVHHTWKPTKEQWQGERSILGLKGYYERKGWTAGPHLFVAEDGIWLFSPMRHNGIHASTLNPRSVGIEVVGNYDNIRWSGETKKNALGVIRVLMQQLSIFENGVFFHRDVSAKTCPGTAITKAWLFHELMRFELPASRPVVPSEFRERVEDISAPLPAATDPLTSSVLMPIPDWAQEAVDFVQEHRLFQIMDMKDVRDAVKFYRFYQLIMDDDES